MLLLVTLACLLPSQAGVRFCLIFRDERVVASAGESLGDGTPGEAVFLDVGEHSMKHGGFQPAQNVRDIADARLLLELKNSSGLKECQIHFVLRCAFRPESER